MLPHALSGKGSGTGTSRKSFAGMSGDPGRGTNSDSDLSEGAAPTGGVIPEPQLRLVDLLEDYSCVWVMLDEGCNQTCHGTGWGLQASSVLARHGLKVLRLDSTGRSFRGVGTVKSAERCLLPFSIKVGKTPLFGDFGQSNSVVLTYYVAYRSKTKSS